LLRSKINFPQARGPAVPDVQPWPKNTPAGVIPVFTGK
jgi:hypothetical protein